MEWYQSVILGMLQGITEFLPISSSGHLVLLQHIFGLKEPEILFDICLHIGTLIAICIIFRQLIWQLIKAIFDHPTIFLSKQALIKGIQTNPHLRMSWVIICGTIPTGIIGICFHHYVDQLFGNILNVGIALIVTGFILWFTRFPNPKDRDILNMTVIDAIIIGIAQGLAILPGISRSGLTICTCLYVGINRQTAAQFSFLLSIPAILGALVLEIDRISFHSMYLSSIILGTVTATIIGFFALKWLLRIVNHGKMFWFAPYCWIIGCLTIIYSQI